MAQEISNPRPARSLAPSKVPQVTLAFWAIKIAATTLGETAGDAVSMTLHLGFALGSAILFALFVAVLALQLRARAYHRFLYWATIVATTTVGTTMADFADRSLGIGYMGGSALLFVALMLTLGSWRWALGSVSVERIATPGDEAFYWVTILFSNTLGTALGDLTSSDSGLGYHGSALLFIGFLALLALAYAFTRASHTFLFWAAFILTRPLGATLGDSLTKPLNDGGLDLSRIESSAAIALFIIVAILFTSRTAGSHPSGASDAGA
jgi:uncharacterized membrane-anchored protein